MKTRPTFVLPVLLAALLGACSLLTNESDAVGSVPFETLKRSFKTSLSDSESYVANPETFVLRSKTDEKAFLRSHSDVLPDVDYSEHVIVGILAGARPNTSYELTIDSVTVGETAKIYAIEVGSAYGGRMITYPAHIIALERKDLGETGFDFEKIERVCRLSPCVWETV